MCCAIHAAPHAAAGVTDAQLCFVQHTTCEFMLSHDFECIIALYKFCSVLCIPLLFALYCVVCAAFAVLIDKAGVLGNCTFCSCKRIFRYKLQLFPWYYHLPCYLPFFSPAISLAPLRTVHSLVLLTAPWVPRLQLNCCIQHYSACLPAILASNLHYFFSIYLGSFDNLHICGLFCYT